jgi:glucose-1-phosphate thymidylyltransferase
MVAHIIDELRAIGIEEYVFVVGYLGDRVREYVDRQYPGIVAHYVQQPDRLGLGHAIHLTDEAVAGRDVLIVLGDTIFRADFSGVLSRETTQIGVKEVEDPRRFGVVLREGDRVVGFVEKPEEPVSRLAIVGIYYVTDSRALYAALGDAIRQGRKTRGEYQLTDALQVMLEGKTAMETFPVEGWYDCGKAETLLATNRDLLDLEASSPEIEGCVVIPPVAIHPQARVERCILGPHATIAEEAVVEDSIVRDSILNQGSRVRHMILEASLVGEDAVVEGAPRKVNIGDSSDLHLA